MKMIRSTRKISVSGVMLISQNIPPSCLGMLTAIELPPGERGVDQACGADVNCRIDALDALREIIVEDHRDDRDDESESGGNQRFGDAGGDNGKTAGPLSRHRLEGDE